MQVGTCSDFQPHGMGVPTTGGLAKVHLGDGCELLSRLFPRSTRGDGCSSRASGSGSVMVRWR